MKKLAAVLCAISVIFCAAAQEYELSYYQEFDSEGIQKIADLAGDDLFEVINRMKALKKADKKYDIFTDKSEGASSRVKFIIETDEINTEED